MIPEHRAHRAAMRRLWIGEVIESLAWIGGFAVLGIILAYWIPRCAL